MCSAFSGAKRIPPILRNDFLQKPIDAVWQVGATSVLVTIRLSTGAPQCFWSDRTLPTAHTPGKRAEQARGAAVPSHEEYVADECFPTFPPLWRALSERPGKTLWQKYGKRATPVHMRVTAVTDGEIRCKRSAAMRAATEMDGDDIHDRVTLQYADERHFAQAPAGVRGTTMPSSAGQARDWHHGAATEYAEQPRRVETHRSAYLFKQCSRALGSPLWKRRGEVLRAVPTVPGASARGVFGCVGYASAAVYFLRRGQAHSADTSRMCRRERHPIDQSRCSNVAVSAWLPLEAGGRSWSPAVS